MQFFTHRQILGVRLILRVQMDHQHRQYQMALLDHLALMAQLGLLDQSVPRHQRVLGDQQVH